MQHDQVTVSTTVTVKREDGTEHKVSVLRQRQSPDPIPLTVAHLTRLSAEDVVEAAIQLEARITA